MDKKQFKKVCKILNYLIKKGKLKGKKIILFGATKASKQIRDYLYTKNFEIFAILENSNKAGKRALGVKIYRPEQLLQPYSEEYVILIYSQYQVEMLAQLEGLGYGKQSYGLYEKGNTAKVSVGEFYGILGSAVYGKILYKKYLGKYKKYKVLLYPFTGLGDMYLLGLYLKQYLDKEKIDNYVFVVINRGCYKVAKLFGIKDVLIISEEHVRHIVNAYMSFGDEKVPLKLMIDNWVHTIGVRNIRGYRDLNFAQMFRACVFGLDDTAVFQHPKVVRNEDAVASLFEKYNLKKGKTVIIAPYANTLNDLSKTILQEMAEELKSNGFTVCTNSSGDKEPAIKGTEPVLFPMEHMLECCDYAGFFVSTRSGLCDVICQSSCKKIILYLKDNYFGAGTYFQYFSMNQMGICDDAIEIEYEDTDQGYERMKQDVLNCIITK